jgi:hypothetical protein
MRQLNESLEPMSMEDQILPTVCVDKYKSKIGDDDELVVLSFTVKQKAVGEDLSEWFEKGYDWIIDAEISPGEISDSRYLVFVEINRRTAVPDRICELLEDLQTLTNMSCEDWAVEIDGEEYPAEPEVLRKHIITSPHEYRMQKDNELNEWRERAGLKTKSTYIADDEIKAWQRQAGIL